MWVENEEGEPIGFLGIQYTSDDFHGCCGKPERHEMLKLKFFVEEKLKPLLESDTIFGVNLYEAGVAGLVVQYFKELAAGPGAVRATLVKYV